MQVEVKEIIKYAEEYLKVKNFQDYCVNGLQVEGAGKVSKILTGLSLSKQLIDTAIKKRAKMIIVHHGFFFNEIGNPPQIKGHNKERLKLLLSNNINLAGFHLPLDAHPQIGVNISLLKILGLKKIDVIASKTYGTIGYIGEYDQKVSLKDFVDLVNEKLQTRAYIRAGGPKTIKRVGVIGGGAPREYTDALDQGIDTYLTGEIRESSYWAAEEDKINFVAAGHYNTEKAGIKNLGEVIQKKFNIKVEFIDIECDI